jgi:hypothetical protein
MKGSHPERRESRKVWCNSFKVRSHKRRKKMDFVKEGNTW